MSKYREWTKEEYANIKKTLQADRKAAPRLAKQYNTSVDKIWAAYRRAIGAKHGKYAHTLPGAPEVFNDEDGTFSKEEGYDFINVICASKRMLTKEDIISEFKIDTDIWEVDRFKVKTSEGYRKDREVEWHVTDGKVMQGDVSDSGKMLVVPLYHIEVKFIKKKSIEQVKTAIESFIEDAKKYAPVYSKIEYPSYDVGLLYEIGLPDFHFGRLAWREETGGDYDVQIAKKTILSVLDKLLAFSSGFPLARILFPLGNDYFNVDSKFNTTTGGTPQQEDTRWQKTFQRGRELAVEMIDRCSQIAPVDVVIVPGNHDEQRSFYLGEAITCWYHNNPNVSIDNRAVARKYYQFNKDLICLTHGSDERLEKLPLLMALEEPKKWADTLFREVHTGDKHHKRDLQITADESSGVVVRILRSLAQDDSWTFKKGFKSTKAGEGFLWHPTLGLQAQFTAIP